MPNHSERVLLEEKVWHETESAILTAGVRSLLIANGVAAIAVLGFVESAIEEPDRALVGALSNAFLCFGIGASAAAIVNVVRYRSSLAFRFGWASKGRWIKCEEILLLVACACFLAGLVASWSGVRSWGASLPDVASHAGAAEVK